MNDTMNIKGVFTLRVIDAKTGQLLEEYIDRNLVVNGGRTAVTRLLGGDVANRSITKIAFGTNGNAPAAADNAITNSFVKPLGALSYPTINSVKWEWTLEENEGNGIGIREYGLLCNNDVLFARKTREVINKNTSIRLVGTWEVSF
jgi:hypothetical protein